MLADAFLWSLTFLIFTIFALVRAVIEFRAVMKERSRLR